MSDIADESSQQINAGKGYKSVVLEDVTWEQIYSQAKVIFSDTPCSWMQLMWNNVGERKNKSKWQLKGKWKFKISSPGSIVCTESFRWETAPIALAIMTITLLWNRRELPFAQDREQHPSLKCCLKVLLSSWLCRQKMLPYVFLALLISFILTVLNRFKVLCTNVWWCKTLLTKAWETVGFLLSIDFTEQKENEET